MGAVTNIDRAAFYNCTALSDIDWGTSLKTIEFNNNWNGRNYGEGAFENCTGLTTLDIPNTVTAIGESTFQNCDGLRTVTIGSKVTMIDRYAFKDCNNVSQITLGSSLTTIGNEAFEDCSKLQSIVIPSSVTAMGAYAFYNCDALTSVKIGTGLGTVSEFAFAECASLESVDLGAVTKINRAAFYNCTALSNINWGTSLKTIEFNNNWDGRNYGKGAFENCIGLSTVSIPGSVTVIGQNTFKGCTGLTKVYFGDKLQTIESYAFSGCNNIADIYYTKSKSDWDYVNVSETGNEPILNPKNGMQYNYGADTTKPTVSINTTNKVATSQTVTLNMSDNVGVVSYYWGTNSSPASSSFTPITSTTSTTLTKTVSSAGTYYLIAKDAAGNTSELESATFYKITLDGNGGNVSLNYVISKSGSTVTLPIPKRDGYNFVGWGTSATSTTGLKSVTVTLSKTYYAVWEKIPELEPEPDLVGDVNGDGSVDAGDAGLISRYDAGLITLTATQLEAGDVNGDGVVDAGDAGLISRYDAGLISSLG